MTKRWSHAAGDAKTLDRLSSVLKGEYRRRVLDYFDTWGDEPTSLADIAGYVAACRTEPSPSEEAVHHRLYHVDVPKLADAGIIEFDESNEIVEYRGHPQIEKIDDRWRIVSEG